MSTPQKGCGTPYACSSPLLKESSASPEDPPDLTKSSAVPSVIIEDVIDDDDEASAPDKSGSLSVKSTHGRVPNNESHPLQRRCRPNTQKPINRGHAKCPTHHEMNGGRCDTSKKGPDYKQMQYLTFAPMSELETVIFEKCSFNQPPTLTSVPSASFGQAVPKLQDHLQRNHLLAATEPEEHRPLLEKGHGPGESFKAISLHFQCARGLDPVEVPKVMDPSQGP